MSYERDCCCEMCMEKERDRTSPYAAAERESRKRLEDENQQLRAELAALKGKARGRKRA